GSVIKVVLQKMRRYRRYQGCARKSNLGDPTLDYNAGKAPRQMLTTGFDQYTIRFLNSYANRWQVFDSVILLLRITDLLKGGIICALVWWAWFRTDDDQKRSRGVIVASLVAAFGAMFSSRGLALILPFRYRPLHNPEIEFQLPYGMSPETLD